MVSITTMINMKEYVIKVWKNPIISKKRLDLEHIYLWIKSMTHQSVIPKNFQFLKPIEIY